MNKQAFEQALKDNRIVRYKDSFEAVVKRYDKLSGREELLDACEWALSELAEPETSSADTLHETIERLKTAIKKATQ